MVRKTRAHRTSTSFSSPSFDSEKFLSEENQETYEKLNFLRYVWVERKVILDEFDLEIRRNFERRVWLPLVDIDHPPLATLDIGEEYAITLSVVAFALGVPKVQHHVSPYDESPPLDDIMSYFNGSSI